MCRKSIATWKLTTARLPASAGPGGNDLLPGPCGPYDNAHPLVRPYLHVRSPPRRLSRRARTAARHASPRCRTGGRTATTSAHTPRRWEVVDTGTHRPPRRSGRARRQAPGRLPHQHAKPDGGRPPEPRHRDRGSQPATHCRGTRALAQRPHGPRAPHGRADRSRSGTLGDSPPPQATHAAPGLGDLRVRPRRSPFGARAPGHRGGQGDAPRVEGPYRALLRPPRRSTMGRPRYAPASRRRMPIEETDQIIAAPSLLRAMRFRDVVLFLVITGFSVRFIANASVTGPSAAVVWVGAALFFQLPLALTVLELSSRYPGEGGIYVWTKQAFGGFSGFITAWTYWCSNLPYFPGILYFMAANALYLSGAYGLTLSGSPAYFVISSMPGSEIGNPRRTLPRALLIAGQTLALLFVGATIAILVGPPPDHVTIIS